MSLTPRSRFPRGLLRFPLSNFPSLWEDFEEGLAEGSGLSQDGLSVYEDEGRFFIEAQMPGLDVKNIDVTVDKGVVRISGSKEEKEEDKAKKYHRRASYSWSYQIALPSGIDESQAGAVYQNGVMQLSFPKKVEAKTKKIEVKAK